jgi:hypothetical protein
MANDLGELRRSAVVSTFGPGSIIDFRAGPATISAVAAGLEEWDRSFPPAGLMNQQSIQEPRLQKKLGVQGFRLPPVADTNFRRGAEDSRNLVAARFPDWLQCPSCDRIAPSRKWNRDPGKAYRYCGSCTAKMPGGAKCFVIPVRFVLACERGHLDDFPWDWWLQHAPNCKTPQGGPLKLVAERPGHAGLILSCPQCNTRRSMDGIFSKQTWDRFNCSGKRPWLAAESEQCAEHPRALQRGASNLYFPITESALTIPPWSDRLQETIGIYWDSIVGCKPEQRADFIAMLANGAALSSALAELKMTPAEVAHQIERRLKQYEDLPPNLREEEYQLLTSRQDTDRSHDKEFEIRNVPIPASLQSWFSHLVKVVRLREVRALRGFTRIVPPGDPDGPKVAHLSVKQLQWLPAIEVRGEGIFLVIDEERLKPWEGYDPVKQRAKEIDVAWKREWRNRHGADSAPPTTITARYLLVHTFAHALMRQLTLECGYSSASLRERIYVSEGNTPMGGLLIFTATPDADGTLGGLQRQGDASRIVRTIQAAVQSMEWCSSDPLCIEGMLAKPESFLQSACHACVLAPETSCEEFNRFLDRAMIVGLPRDRKIGFFNNFARK